MSALDAAERLKEDVSTLLEAGRSTAREYGAAGASFRKLVLSDIALARVALIRGLVFLLLATLMAGTAWVALMCLVVVGLNTLGLHLLWALLLPLVGVDDRAPDARLRRPRRDATPALRLVHAHTADFHAFAHGPGQPRPAG